MTAWETYIALIKGYCCIVPLMMPRAFMQGGYVFSPVVLIASCFITSFAALKLVKVGQILGISSYSLVTLKVLGSKAKNILDFMIFMT